MSAVVGPEGTPEAAGAPLAGLGPAGGAPRDDRAGDPARLPREHVGPGRPARSPVSAVKDNLEAVAFALVMALLLRHFCVEVFKIPTASMKPTLLGDDPGAAPPTIGDRIIVDKWAYLTSDPERWDVPVFRFPLDRSRNFIKRIAILPDEEGRLERGDVWVRRAGSDEPFRVATKPRDVRETLYVPVYPPTSDADPVDLNAFGRDRDAELDPRLDEAAAKATAAARAGAYAAVEADFALKALPLVRARLGGAGPGEPGRRELEALERRLTERARLRHYWIGADGPRRAWDLRSFDRFAFRGGPPESIVYAFGITDSTHARDASRDTTGSPVVDVRLRLSVEADGDAAVELSWRPGDGRRAVLRLASDAKDSSRAAVALPGARGDRDVALGERLVPGRSHDLELEFVDGEARAWVDGREVAVLPAHLSIDEAVARQDPDAPRDGGSDDPDDPDGPGDPDGSNDPDPPGAQRRQELRVTAEGSAVEVRGVRVDHDLYYHSARNNPSNEPAEGASIVVPPRSYFMLGDNTRHSHDSRQWTANGVRLREGREDGLVEVWWDSQTSPRSERSRPGDDPARGRRKTVTDVDGVLRSWWDSEDGGELPRRRTPFVTRDMIVGRAFFALVFWPPKEVPARFRLIH